MRITLIAARTDDIVRFGVEDEAIHLDTRREVPPPPVYHVVFDAQDLWHSLDSVDRALKKLREFVVDGLCGGTFPNEVIERGRVLKDLLVAAEGVPLETLRVAVVELKEMSGRPPLNGGLLSGASSAGGADA